MQLFRFSARVKNR